MTLGTHAAHHAGWVLVYGEASTAVPGLGPWYARQGFEVLPAGAVVDLTVLLDHPAVIHAMDSHQFFVSRWARPARARF